MTAEKTVQVVGNLKNSQKFSVSFNESGVFQLMKNQHKNIKRIFGLTKKISLKIVQIEMVKKNNYRFLLRVTGDSQQIQVYIQSKEELELLFRIMANFATVSDLQETVISFKKIGEGSFAEVYLAVTSYQATFAAKCFQKQQLLDHPKSKKSFHNQIQMMRHLKSKYIISFDYIFETQKAYYLKLEYFDNSLSKELSKKKMLAKDQKRIMKQLLLALQQMKNRGIIHRDLKPENIMIRKTANGEGQCVLIDFGLATFQNTHPYIYWRCGTPGFIAPEIANLTNKMQRQTCAVDMFSLGCIFFLILTGHHLFSDKTASDILIKNKKCDFPPSFLNRLSDKQKDLFLKMTEVKPSHRITPEAALKHTYFDEDIDDCDEIPEEQCVINKHLKRLSRLSHSQVKRLSVSIQSGIGNSASSITSKFDCILKRSIRDSCLTFEIGPNALAARNGQNEWRLKRTANKSLRKSQQRASRFGRNENFDVQII